MGVSGGVWECGKPERFSIISMPQSEGEKGDRKSTRLNSSHEIPSRMPSSA